MIRITLLAAAILMLLGRRVLAQQSTGQRCIDSGGNDAAACQDGISGTVQPFQLHRAVRTSTSVTVRNRAGISA
jgi:hypothetical protein